MDAESTIQAIENVYININESIKQINQINELENLLKRYSDYPDKEV